MVRRQPDVELDRKRQIILWQRVAGERDMAAGSIRRPAGAGEVIASSREMRAAVDMAPASARDAHYKVAAGR